MVREHIFANYESVFIKQNIFECFFFFFSPSVCLAFEACNPLNAVLYAGELLASVASGPGLFVFADCSISSPQWPPKQLPHSLKEHIFNLYFCMNS